MLHPKSDKSKKGEYEYTHKIAKSSNYPSVDECEVRMMEHRCHPIWASEGV